MSVIKKIRECIDSEFNEVEIAIYSPKEVTVNLYEKRVPIIINTVSEEICFDTELYNGRLFTEEISEIYKVMQVLREGMQEIKEWVTKG